MLKKISSGEKTVSPLFGYVNNDQTVKPLQIIKNKRLCKKL